MHCMITDMESGAVIDSCRSEKFGCLCSSGLFSDSTALNCYVRGSIHEIQNRLPIVTAVQR